MGTQTKRTISSSGPSAQSSASSGPAVEGIEGQAEDLGLPPGLLGVSLPASALGGAGCRAGVRGSPICGRW
jgi:hypothetical protein